MHDIACLIAGTHMVASVTSVVTNVTEPRTISRMWQITINTPP